MGYRYTSQAIFIILYAQHTVANDKNKFVKLFGS